MTLTRPTTSPSAFDKIYLQPCGDLNLLGYKVNSPFLRSLFDRLGILPEFVQRKEYKNAPNMFTETKFTPAHKESVQSILAGMYEMVKDGIARGRRQTAERVEQLMCEGPLTATEAKDRGLVDELVYESELIPILKKMPPKEQHPPGSAGSHLLDAGQPQLTQSIGPSSTTLHPVTATAHTDTSSAVTLAPVEKSVEEQKREIEKQLAEAIATMKLMMRTDLRRFDAYAQKVLVHLDSQNTALRLRGGPKIALIYGLGEVTTRLPARSFGQAPAGVFHSSTLAKAIYNAARDPRVEVILFRIDSPGGSYVAADTIHAALKEAKLKGKKLVVSMGSMAASGGYFAAAPADTIFANDATLTGSIGVFGGKFALRRFLEDKVSLSFDQLQVGGGDTAGMYSLLDPWTPPQLAKMNSMMDRIYADFVGKVAAGRRLTFGRVEKLARGRVWTGLEARNNGLVDEAGGLWDAIEYAKRLIDPTMQRVIPVEQLPKKKSLLTLLAEGYSATNAEKDDKPLFSSTLGQTRAVVAATMEEAVMEGVGMAEARLMQELMAFVSGGQSVGGMGVNVNAGGTLHDMGILSPQGKLLL